MDRMRTWRGIVLSLSAIAFCLLSGRQQLCHALDGPPPISNGCACGPTHDETYVRTGDTARVAAGLAQPHHVTSTLLPGRDFRGPLPSDGAPDSRGTDFVIAFPDNIEDTDALLIITAGVFTSGIVSVPGIGWSQNFTVQPSSPAEVSIPVTAEVQGSGISSDLGIHVTTDHVVSVYFLSPAVRLSATCDAYLALPSDILGNEYIILGYPETLSGRGFPPTRGPSQFTLVGTTANTQVTVTPSANTLDGRPAGVPFTITLSRFDTYQLQAGYQQDLSGSEVVSTQPIAVFAGCKCADIPIGFSYCDFIVEQMTPVETWGSSFLTSVFTRPGSSVGDPLRVLASEDNTTVSFTPPVPGSPFALNRAELVEVTVEGPTEIVADKPVLVAQYATGSSWAGALGDPLETLILPTEQFLDGYIYLTPAGYALDFTSIVVPTAAIPSLLFDGSPVNPGVFSPIGSTGYSYGTVAVSDGCHIVTADCPFGIYVYGWCLTVSYGYPGGLRLVVAPSLVTGGGWIPGGPPGPGSKKTFGFNAHSEAGPTWAQLQFNDHATKMRVHSDTVKTLVIQPGDTIANFSGDCRVDGVSGYRFECEVMDRGEPGRGVDKFSLHIYDGDGNLYYSAGDFLGGGNIQIHTPTDTDLADSGPEPQLQPRDALNSLPDVDDGIQVLSMAQGLLQNSPNPCRQFTIINYQLPRPGHTSLRIYDLTGKLMTTLVNGTKPAGHYAVEWNGKDSSGREVATGIYVYRLVVHPELGPGAADPALSGAEVFTATKKMVILR